MDGPGRPQYPAGSTTDRSVGVLVAQRVARREPGAVMAVVHDHLLIGRGAECDLVLASSNVSRRHARIWSTASGFLIEDAGSRNGTWLDGVRIWQAHAVRPGQHIGLGDVELEFQLDDASSAPAVPWHRPVDPALVSRTTEPMPTPNAGPDAASASTPGAGPERGQAAKPALKDEVTGKTITMSVLASGVGTLVSQGLGSGRWGALAFAVFGPLVTAAFTLRADRRIRKLPVVVVTVIAFALTFGGVSIADLVAGHSVLPGAQDRGGTFPGVGSGNAIGGGGGGGTSGPGIRTPDRVSCPTVAVGQKSTCHVPVESTGSTALVIKGINLTGPDLASFSLRDTCSGTLGPGKPCTFTVTFAPTSAGPHGAVVVIHQNLPAPDTGSRIRITADATDAEQSCEAGPSLELSPASGPVDASVTASGTCFPATDAVVLSVSGTPLRKVTTDASGAFTTPITLDSALCTPSQCDVVAATSTGGSVQQSYVIAS
jgi:hypothetical protein